MKVSKAVGDWKMSQVWKAMVVCFLSGRMQMGLKCGLNKTRGPKLWSICGKGESKGVVEF